MIHEASATSVDTRLRRAVLPLSPSTYGWGLALFFLAPVPWPPRASLATRLSDFATNRHESCGLGACPSPAPRWTGQPARVVGSRGRAQTVTYWDVDQPLRRPPSMQERMPAGYRAHIVRDLVRESPDVSAILKPDTAARRFPLYDPTRMTTLLLSADSHRLYAS
jgi:hypothetical protein